MYIVYCTLQYNSFGLQINELLQYTSLGTSYVYYLCCYSLHTILMDIFSDRLYSVHWTMVFRLDGNSEIGAQAKCHLFYLIYLMHFISRAVTNRIFFQQKLFSFIRSQHVLSYHPIYVPWQWTDDQKSEQRTVYLFINADKWTFLLYRPLGPLMYIIYAASNCTLYLL